MNKIVIIMVAMCLLSITIVSATLQDDVREYWIAEGLSVEEATAISKGLSNNRNITIDEPSIQATTINQSQTEAENQRAVDDVIGAGAILVFVALMTGAILLVGYLYLSERK